MPRKRANAGSPRSTPPPATAPVDRYRILRFTVLFGCALAVYFVLTSTLRFQNPAEANQRPVVARLVAASEFIQARVVVPYHEFLAVATAATVRMFGYEVRVSGRDLRTPSGDFAVTITSGCDAAELTLLLCVAILLFPLPWTRRVAGLLVAAAFIAVVNFLRIVSLWIVGVNWSPAFDVVHFCVWPFLLICTAVVAFVFWIRLAVPVGRAA